MQEGTGSCGGSQAGDEEHQSDWRYVREYAAKAGGVSEQIGSAARQEAARDEFIADAMARLRQGLISLEDFRLYMQSRGGDEAAQVRATSGRDWEPLPMSQTAARIHPPLHTAQGGSGLS